MARTVLANEQVADTHRSQRVVAAGSAMTVKPSPLGQGPLRPRRVGTQQSNPRPVPARSLMECHANGAETSLALPAPMLERVL